MSLASSPVRDRSSRSRSSLRRASHRFLAGTLFVAAAVVVSGCAPKLIPNTTIRDTEDNRQILEVIRKYKNAFEAQDAQAIAALASPRYLDSRDNVSYDTLVNDLAEDFEKVKQVQLDIAVKRIEIERDIATVDYFFSSNVLIRGEGEDQWRTQTDDKRMTLVRDGDRKSVV